MQLGKKKLTAIFIDGAVPSEADYQLAKDVSGAVVFKNAQADVPGTYIKDYDVVLGCVPERYWSKYDKETGALKPTVETTTATSEKDGGKSISSQTKWKKNA